MDNEGTVDRKNSSKLPTKYSTSMYTLPARYVKLFCILIVPIFLFLFIGLSSKPSTFSLRSWRLALLSESTLESVLPSWLHVLASVLLARTAPSVIIRQGTIVGKIIDDATLPQPLDAFLGIPYGLPPTGSKRFSPPEPVGPSDDIIDASTYGYRCPSKPLVSLAWKEDCLNLNIFRPSNTNTAENPLPVAVYIHGGGFNSGSGQNHNSASMLAWSENPYIAVNFNYRLGAFGFLPSEVTAKEGLLNAGLHDQILLLKWIQNNIKAFGGDPNQVTIFGLSAGAHSVGHHILNYSENKRPLFHRAMLESGAATSRAVYPYDAKLNEIQFDEFLIEAGCFDIPENDIVNCLRNKTAMQIAQASTTIFDLYNRSDRWAFQPAIDGEIIKQAPITVWDSGEWNRVPILTGFNTDEGAPFVPSTMSESTEFIKFFKTLIPSLPASDLDLLEKLYPDPSTDPSSPYIDTRPINVGSQYKRATAAYGQFAYICPVQQTAHIGSAGQDPPVFLYHWALNKTVKGGASHSDQVEYEIYSPGVRKISSAQEEIAGFLHAYLTSFITTGDPNLIQGKFASRPVWEPLNANQRNRVMILGKGNDERAGGDGVGVSAQLGNASWTKEECKFWSERSILTES